MEKQSNNQSTDYTDYTDSESEQSAIRNPRSAKVGLKSKIENQKSKIGFTLVELLMVIFVIALVLTITLPSVIGLFTAGADLQARNVIGSIMGAARGVAVANQSYALVHVQLDSDGKCWAAVMKYNNDPTTPRFVPVDGFPPQQMPGDMAFGEISTTYVSGGTYTTDMNDDAGLANFTTFNVIFGPDGSLATKVDGYVPNIATNVKIFGWGITDAKQQIWNGAGLPSGPALNEEGVRAITAFHYKTLEAMGTGRQGWLEKNGQFLCINPYTGKLLATK